MTTIFLRAMRSAIAALAFAAMACGGGDPPGGGNNSGTNDGGGTADGTIENGSTDGHVPNPNNPLIEVLPGEWRATLVDGQPPDPPFGGTVRDVDAEDPDCTNALEDSGEDFSSVGPPGDACIYWTLIVNFVILDGTWVRHEDPIDQLVGNVLNNGWRIVFTLTNAELDTSTVIEYEKIE